jgi:multidrug efflux pump subunit AcrA (membrane-fusion protein)
MRIESTIFRNEALQAHSRGHVSGDGSLPHIAPAWTSWLYWLLIGLFVATAFFAIVGRVDEFASGVAVIRDEGRTLVTASVTGAIRRVAVQAGQRVEAKQPLVYFDDLQERIELERLRHDFTSQQVTRLRNPNDAAAQQQIAMLKGQIEAAERRLVERTVVSPRAGIVQDVRLRLNQMVSSGELLMTIVGANDALLVLAVLPGQYRPLLKEGAALRLELTGFRYAYQQVTIDTVGNEVVGPAEVRRFLGQEIADAAKFEGPSIIVQARLPARRFKADGQWREYHDGMHGMAEARVRSQIILAALVPGVRVLLEKNHE